MPLVSCIIPSYKRNDMIVRAIDSILAQTYPNLEILVIDDNVPGDEYSRQLSELIKHYDNEKVKLVIQKEHINGAAARNKGISVASGEYIAFLDDDDEWLPSKIEKQISFIMRHPEIKGVSTLYSIYSNGKLVTSQKEYSTENLQLKVFLREVDITTVSFLATKESLINIGGFDEHLIRHQDLQLFVAFLDSYRIGLVPEILVKVHSDSAINRPNMSKLIRVKKDYFESVQKYLEKYSQKDQKRILANHNFEIAYIALKEKEIMTFIKYLFKACMSFPAIRDLFSRLSERL